MKIKKLARKLQAEISDDPALAKPSYAWCREQVIARLGTQDNPYRIPASLLAEEAVYWPAFVAEVKTRSRRAG
jgi:hypothetical protein